MLATLETFFRNWRRRLSRSEWAVRHLGLKSAEGKGEEPGILLIQIDGLAREQLERALAHGRMPFLRRVLRQEGYALHNFYGGLPTTTPSVQAELFYGVRSAVPGFGFFDRERREFITMYSPDRAKEVEAHCAAQAEGLLAGGSSWSNIYTGGAGQLESHFCIATNGARDMWRTGKIKNIFVFILLHFSSTLRLGVQIVAEFFLAIGDAWRGIRRGEAWWMELLMVLSRVFIGVGLRELLTIGVSIDVTRGLPITHVNFVGYDENAHRRGPGSFFAHWTLRGIDRSIKNIYRAAQRSRRRDYVVWIFSDHGQEKVRSLSLEHPGRIETVVAEFIGQPSEQATKARERQSLRGEGPWHTLAPGRGRRLKKVEAMAQAAASKTEPFVYASLGPVGHLYFRKELSLSQKQRLAQILREKAEVPGVVWRDAGGATHWLHAGGEAVGEKEIAEILPQKGELRAEVARDLVGLAESKNVGELMLLGITNTGTMWTFAPERGAHAGPGVQETKGFALLPTSTRLPAKTDEFIRPSALRLAALNHLGRAPFAGKRMDVAPRDLIRLMTYNVHACSGMDGRISPRRVARAIGAQRPDIVALQEIDLGRRRSRTEDQAKIIAEDLGLHAVFVPTVTRENEHYGHALLSAWPIEVLKRGRLPHDPKSVWQEARAALWARISIAGRPVNVITTHFGLGAKERTLQMQALMGDAWLGAVPAGEPVLICGDFNSLPQSVPYRLAVKKMRDVQRGRKILRTFSSNRPLIRIDHIFISEHFETLDVAVPRNAVTRVASDHLPLIAELRLRPDGAAASGRA